MENTLKKTSTEHRDQLAIDTKDISFEVDVDPVESESDPIRSVYVFSYTIKLVNNTLKNIQLINRHWKVISDGKQIADVKGDGVVGHQPRFRPSDSFQYTSYTALRDPVGEMHGSFTFITEDELFFDLVISPFKLSYIDRLSLH